MLLHVTATHTEDNCPGYNVEKIPEVMKGLIARADIAKQHNVKLLGLWSGAPDHVFYWLVEADSVHDVDLLMTESTPFKQAYRVTPVITGDELVKLAQEMLARANQ
ncbi:MAG: hypothetical protein M3P30_03110 [Chloroflexota bacterium]|nr:hypothetical protein [Chloroflexota bacterium]